MYWVAGPRPPALVLKIRMLQDLVLTTFHHLMSSDLTSTILPKTSATITVRLIKSFEYRAEKSLVLRNTNLEKTTVRVLKEQVLQSR